jgi:hypothetical protein
MRRENTVNLQEFQASVAEDSPPEGLSAALLVLWHDAKGDWNHAHGMAQDLEDADGAWVHAYLHRVEGDLANAGYWYRRANRAPTSQSLEDEWAEIARELLSQQ